jgi:hypothetical protein
MDARHSDTTRKLIGLYLPTLAISIGQGLILPAVPALAQHFGVSPGIAAQIVTAFAAGRLAALIPSGMLVDRIGPGRVLLLGSTSLVAGALLIAVTPVFWGLLIGQCLAGAGSSLWTAGREISGLNLVRADQRGRLLSGFFGLQLAGTALAAVAGGVITDAAGLRVLFAANLLVGLAVLVLTAVIERVAPSPAPAPLQPLPPGRLHAIAPDHRSNDQSGQLLGMDYLSEDRRQAYLNEASRLMGIRQVGTEIGQLEIRTDILDGDEVKMLGQVVEAAIRAHEEFWAPLVPLRPFNQQVLVYAWARQADHDRVHRLWRAGWKGAAKGPQATPTVPAARAKVWSFIGEYIPASRILSVPCERMGGHLPVPIVIHEAIHMLDYERAYEAGARPSQWFEEGLATYFGFSQIGARLNIEAGDIQRSGTIVSGPVRLQFDPRTPLHEYIKRIRDDGPMPLRALLESKADDPSWNGDRTIRAYGASWTLVHFLLHGARGAHRAAFGECARAEAQGLGGYDTFVRLFGPDLGPLEDAWHRYEEDL